MIRYIFLAFLVCCPLLFGCSNKSVEPPAPGAESALSTAPPSSPLVSFIAGNEQGASSKIQDTEFGNVTVFVEEAYISALGRQCKKARVQVTRECAEVVAICKEDGRWAQMPSIWRSCLSALPSQSSY